MKEQKDHLGNEYESLNAMCKVYGINSKTYTTRRRKGMSIEEALTGSVRPQEIKCYDHLGNEFKNKKTMCEAYDIPWSTYKARVRNGWSLKDTLTTKVIDSHAWKEQYLNCHFDMPCGLGFIVTKVKDCEHIIIKFDRIDEIKITSKKSIDRKMISPLGLGRLTRKNHDFCGFKIIRDAILIEDKAFYSAIELSTGYKVFYTPDMMIDIYKEK